MKHSFTLQMEHDFALFLPFVCLYRACWWMHTLTIGSADVYRGIFKFGVFNAVQSACYDDVSNSHLTHGHNLEVVSVQVMHSQENLVSYSNKRREYFKLCLMTTRFSAASLIPSKNAQLME